MWQQGACGPRSNRWAQRARDRGQAAGGSSGQELWLSRPVLCALLLCRGHWARPFFCLLWGTSALLSAPEQGLSGAGPGGQSQPEACRPSRWGRVRRGSNSGNPKSQHQPPCVLPPLHPAQSSASASPPRLACCWVSPVPQLPRAPEHRAGPPAPPALCLGVLSNGDLESPPQWVGGDSENTWKKPEKCQCLLATESFRFHLFISKMRPVTGSTW